MTLCPRRFWGACLSSPRKCQLVLSNSDEAAADPSATVADPKADADGADDSDGRRRRSETAFYSFSVFYLRNLSNLRNPRSLLGAETERPISMQSQDAQSASAVVRRE